MAHYEGHKPGGITILLTCMLAHFFLWHLSALEIAWLTQYILLGDLPRTYTVQRPSLVAWVSGAITGHMSLAS
jgi:hypothetical protein